MNWKKLQNGSDIRGVALDGVKGEAVNLTPDVALELGKSFVQWLRNTAGMQNVSVAVGTDSRISGKVLKEAFIQGVCEMGAHILPTAVWPQPRPCLWLPCWAKHRLLLAL